MSNVTFIKFRDDLGKEFLASALAINRIEKIQPEHNYPQPYLILIKYNNNPQEILQYSSELSRDHAFADICEQLNLIQ